jgi:KDO2-lipid IV(A) lauroyltransferase
MSFLLRFAASLPLPLLHVLGAMLGWMIYAASPRYRRHLQANLAQAGYTDATLRRAAIAAAGRGVLELPALWLRPHAGVAALVREVSGWELVAAAHARGKGILFLTPHLGCFEITAQYYASRAGADAPLTVLYTPPKKKVIEPAMLAGRDRPGLRIAAPDLSGVRAMLRALKNGEAVGILPDQAPGVGQGEWTEFFGKPAYTMTLWTGCSDRVTPASFLPMPNACPEGAVTRCILRQCPRPSPASTRCASSIAPSKAWCAVARHSITGVTTVTRCRPAPSRSRGRPRMPDLPRMRTPGKPSGEPSGERRGGG